MKSESVINDYFVQNFDVEHDQVKNAQLRKNFDVTDRFWVAATTDQAAF